MKDKLEQRLQNLNAIPEEELGPQRYYERQLLQALFTQNMPNYDDLEDFKNIEVALDRVKALLVQTVQNYYSSV